MQSRSHRCGRARNGAAVLFLAGCLLSVGFCAASTNDTEDFEYLLKPDTNTQWRVTQVFPFTLGFSSIRIETAPTINAPAFSRAAVYRKGELKGFLRLLQPIAGGYAISRLARSIDPSEIRYNDELLPFELVKVRRAEFDDLPQDRQKAARAALRDLGNQDFKTREKATRTLCGFGRELLVLLGEAMSNADPEIRHRAERIRDTILRREQPVDTELAGVLLRRSGKQKPAAQQGFLGVSIEDVKEGRELGAMVMQVVDGTAAMRCGLQIQDIMLSIDDDILYNSTDVLELISAKAPGSTVSLRVRRGERDMEIKAVLTARPQPLPF